MTVRTVPGFAAFRMDELSRHLCLEHRRRITMMAHGHEKGRGERKDGYENFISI